MIDIWLTCCHLHGGAYYWQQLGMFGLLMNMLSPCLQRILYKVTVILFDNSMTWLTYDYRVVTLLAEHTIDNNSACLVYCFHVCVSHRTNIHTIVSSLQHLLGIPSLQQLAFSLYQGGFVSWRLQEQELLRQQQRQCQSLVRMRKGVSQQQEHVNVVNANQRSDKTRYGRPIGRACRWARMSVRGATKWDTADQSDGACRGAHTSVRGATCRE